MKMIKEWKIIDVIKVVYKNFFKILGFFGAPGSLPSKLFLKGFSLCFIPIGKAEKKTIHQIITNTTIEPVIPIKPLLY